MYEVGGETYEGDVDVCEAVGETEPAHYRINYNPELKQFAES